MLSSSGADEYSVVASNSPPTLRRKSTHRESGPEGVNKLRRDCRTDHRRIASFGIGISPIQTRSLTGTYWSHGCYIVDFRYCAARVIRDEILLQGLVGFSHYMLEVTSDEEDFTSNIIPR